MIAPRYIRLARSNATRDHCLSGLRGKGARVVLQYLEAAAEAEGVRLRVGQKKRRPLLSAFLGRAWPTVSTSGRDDIWLSDGYAGRSTGSKARILAHELVHPRQWRLYRSFAARYAVAGFRWAMEVQAIRGELHARWALGNSPARLRRWADRESGRQHEFYKLGRLGAGSVRKETLAILYDEIAELERA